MSASELTTTAGTADRGSRARTVRSFCERLWADSEGWVFVGHGYDPQLGDGGKFEHGRWEDKSFSWPRQADQLVAHIVEESEGCDIYVTPGLSSNPVRALDLKNPRHNRRPLAGSFLWCDLDEADDLALMKLKQLQAGGGFVVASGRGARHLHAYIALDERTGPEMLRVLNRRLVVYLDGDPSPSALNGYLRPPGSYNWKPTVLVPGSAPVLVQVDTTTEGNGWSCADLDEMLPEVPDGHGSWSTAVAEPVDGNLPASIREILADPADVTDRSGRHFALVQAAVRLSYSDGQVLTIVGEHQPSRAKYRSRLEAETRRALGKVRTRPTASASNNGHGSANANGHIPSTDTRDEADEPEAAIAPDGYRLTDAGNAARLVDLANGRLRYVHAWGRWVVYKRSGVWAVDNNDALVTEVAKRVAVALFKLLPKCSDEKAKSDERKSELTDRDKVFRWAIRSESAAAIAAMIRLARGIPRVLTEHEDLDADPHLFNVKNGTVNLLTGQLQPHNPDDLMTRQSPIPYDPAAECPLWDACQLRWQPDVAVRDYIQVEAGAAITGVPTETLGIYHGTGGNGKSKHLGALQHVAGPYSAVPHKSLLITQQHEQHSTEKAKMFRVRLAVSEETDVKDTLNDAQVKALTGAGRIEARRMREDPWEFWPTHTLILGTNYAPTIEGRDPAIWRRVRLVPWKVTIPPEEVDLNLAEKLKKEAPGILRWMVQGAVRFLAEGFDPPDAVLAATAAYRAEQDVIGRFISDALCFHPGAWTWSADIKQELETWCDGEGVEPPPRMNDVAPLLKQHGCTKSRSTLAGQKGVLWRGVGIATTLSEQP